MVTKFWNEFELLVFGKTDPNKLTERRFFPLIMNVVHSTILSVLLLMWLMSQFYCKFKRNKRISNTVFMEGFQITASYIWRDDLWSPLNCLAELTEPSLKQYFTSIGREELIVIVGISNRMVSIESITTILYGVLKLPFKLKARTRTS